jgi:hypothetical protein
MIDTRWSRVKTHLEHLYSPIKEIHHLGPGLIPVAITAGRQRINTGAVLAPFVLPEMLCRAGIRQPVGVHIV